MFDAFAQRRGEQHRRRHAFPARRYYYDVGHVSRLQNRPLLKLSVIAPQHFIAADEAKADATISTSFHLSHTISYPALDAVLRRCEHQSREEP